MKEKNLTVGLPLHKRRLKKAMLSKTEKKEESEIRVQETCVFSLYL